MVINNSLYSSNKQNWGTPQWLFDELNSEFNFTFDPCCDPQGQNSKCTNWSSDSLHLDWSNEIVFMNPPYKDVGVWMKKAYESYIKGAVVVCIVPSRTDTKWFHEYALKGEIRFLPKRLKFDGASNTAPFPTCVVIFK